MALNALATPGQLDIRDVQGYRLIQQSGILLRLPQDLIARSIVIFQRAQLSGTAAACLYIVTKTTSPVSPRRLLTAIRTAEKHTVKGSYFTPSEYQDFKSRLFHDEIKVLTAVGFNTHVALPYDICINYLQALGVLNIAKHVVRHINTALLSPQLVFLTHQPTAIAVAAIYLAARQQRVKLPDCAWWEVFDTDREELGFLVVAIQSVSSCLTDP